jgi:hypothetical protein
MMIKCIMIPCVRMHNSGENQLQRYKIFHREAKYSAKEKRNSEEVVRSQKLVEKWKGGKVERWNGGKVEQQTAGLHD